MEENVNEEKEFVEKKKGKILVPIIVTIVVLLIVIGGYVGYFYFFQNTERYIDNISNNVTKFLNKNLKINIPNNKDLDVKINGNLNIQNMIDLDYDITTSPSKKLMALDLNAKNILKGTINYQDDKIYAQASDLYTGILELSDSPNAFNNFSLLNSEKLAELNINESLEKIMKYLFESIKEGKQTTTFKGITQKIYMLELDNITAENASQKFKTLVLNDESLKTLFEGVSNEEWHIFNPCKITVTVNGWTNKVKDFSLKIDENELNAHYDGEKYVLTSNGENLYLWVEDNYLKIHTTEKDTISLGITFNYESGIEYNYKDGEENLNFSLNKVNDQNYKVSGDFSNGDVKVNITGNIEEISSNEAKGNLNLKFTSGTNAVNANLTMNCLTKENLINEINVSGAKKIDELSEEEKNNLMLKLYNILYQSEFLKGAL